MPAFVAELGDIYTRSGNLAEAKKQYELVEYIGLLGHINQVLHNRDLALYYADHGIKLQESLTLARKEFEVRHDVYTFDALAWALYKNGQYQEASDAIDHALAPGTRDALLYYHAGMIAGRLGQVSEARERLQTALNINPGFHVIYADAAREELKALEDQAALTASQGPNNVR
jgi:tetratricopeptide (TPR) repeat protein